MVRTLVSTLALALTVGALSLPAQRVFTPAEGADPLHVAFDRILDPNVRDGLVYYRALKSIRGQLDRYVAALNVPAATYTGWSKDQQIAFWINAYNAFVLETVIDNYPIRGRSASLPASSIKQIPGAFEQIKHRAAGRSVTLEAPARSRAVGARVGSADDRNRSARQCRQGDIDHELARE